MRRLATWGSIFCKNHRGFLLPGWGRRAWGLACARGGMPESAQHDGKIGDIQESRAQHEEPVPLAWRERRSRRRNMWARPRRRLASILLLAALTSRTLALEPSPQLKRDSRIAPDPGDGSAAARAREGDGSGGAGAGSTTVHERDLGSAGERSGVGAGMGPNDRATTRRLGPKSGLAQSPQHFCRPVTHPASPPRYRGRLGSCVATQENGGSDDPGRAVWQGVFAGEATGGGRGFRRLCAPWPPSMGHQSSRLPRALELTPPGIAFVLHVQEQDRLG